MRIFVYGSLKRGHFNHEVLTDKDRGTAKFLGKNAIHGYNLYSLGAYPFILPSQFRTAVFVQGEVYECDDGMVKALDRLEGHPHFYVRQTVELTYSGNEAYAYVMNANVAQRMFEHKRAFHIPSGEWTHEQYKKLPPPEQVQGIAL